MMKHTGDLLHMQADNRSGDPPSPTNVEARIEDDEPIQPDPEEKGLAYLWENLARLGLRETALRVGTSVVSIALFLVVIWVMGNFYLDAAEQTAARQMAIAAGLPTNTPTVRPPALLPPPNEIAFVGGISRVADLHTIIPTRPRFDVLTYTVQPGDTIMTIADKFNLEPQTILWSNYDVLADNPDSLRPGQQLNILPVDGVYYQWHAGDGLNGVAKFFGVSPDEIVNWPGNHLDKNTLGDYTSPNIQPGTWLVVPGGRREFVTWSAPRIPRSNPGVAKVLGPNSCPTAVDGPVGTGAFVWPTRAHYLSGYPFSPETNHWGIDIAGGQGDPVTAADNGVVVYAGWSDLGYGNVVVVDHGNGWQTLYAHLSQVDVACGASVYQGATILGLIGATGNASGPHLHFEMMNDRLGRVNGLLYLK